MDYLLFSMGTTGDVLPFLRLAEALKARGRDVLFLGNERFAETFHERSIPFHCVSSAQAYRDTYDNHLTWTLRFARNHYETFHFPAIKPTYLKIQSLVESGRRPWVIFQDPLSGASMAAQHFQLRSCGVRLAPQAIFSAQSPPYPLSQQVPEQDWPAAMPLIREKASQQRYDKLVTRLLNPLRTELGLPPWQPQDIEDEGSEDLLIGFFPDWLKRRPNDWPSHLRCLGFPLQQTSQRPGARSLNPAITDFVADNGAPLVFTFGTGVPLTPSFVNKLTRVCSFAQRPGILVHYALNQDFHLDREQRFLSVRRADFASLFPLASLVAHHGGIGTTAEALAAGVPQLLSPHTFDQPDNAHLLWRLGVANALNFQTTAATDIARLITELLQSPSVQQSCATYQQRCHFDAVEQAAELLCAPRA